MAQARKFDQRGPADPRGEHGGALADVQQSLERIALSGKQGPAFTLLDRLKGYIDRGVADQQDAFTRVRAYTAKVREVIEITKGEDGSSCVDRESRFRPLSCPAPSRGSRLWRLTQLVN